MKCIRPEILGQECNAENCTIEYSDICAYQVRYVHKRRRPENCFADKESLEGK